MFKESGLGANTTNSKESIREATERLRKENEEKIRKMKEEREKREKGSSEKKEEERKQKQERYSQKFQRKPLNVEKVKAAEYTVKMRDADFSYLDEWMQYEFGRFDWLMGELKIEMQRRMSLATSAEDLEAIKKWNYESLKHTHKQLDDKKKEIWKLKDRVIKTFLYKEDPNDKKEKEAETRFKAEFDVIYDDLHRKTQYTNFADLIKEDKIWAEKARKYTLILEKIKEGNFGSVPLKTWQARLELLKEYKKEIEAFFREADETRKAKKSGDQRGPQKPSGSESSDDGKKKEKQAEQIAIQELGITFAEYKIITSNIERLNDNEIVRLITKVLQCSNEKGEIKKAYRFWAKEWHPDSRKTKFGLGVNEFKFKIANSLYDAYNKRFGR